MEKKQKPRGEESIGSRGWRLSGRYYFLREKVTGRKKKESKGMKKKNGRGPRWSRDSGGRKVVQRGLRRVKGPPVSEGSLKLWEAKRREETGKPISDFTQKM